MAKSIEPKDLGAVIEQELTIYSKNVQERVDNVGRDAIKRLVKLTRETAPVGERKGGNFAKSISSKEVKGVRGSRFIWFVKPPNHRLTHLLVHGHAIKNGGRTKANPFLKNAVGTVLAEYEKGIEEAVKSDN